MYLTEFGHCHLSVVTLFNTQCTHLSVTLPLSPTLYLLLLCVLCVGGLWVNIVCSNFKLCFNKLNILQNLQSRRRWREEEEREEVVALAKGQLPGSSLRCSCFASSLPSTILHCFSLLFSVFSWSKSLLPFLSSSVVIFPAAPVAKESLEIKPQGAEESLVSLRQGEGQRAC